MAIVVQYTKDLPEYNGPLIPGLKPPFQPGLYCDDGDPAEADAFNELIREIRGKASNPAK